MPVQIKGVGSISGLDQGIVVGIATATTFIGALTGNVTGNVTGNISGGTVAGSTGTFSGAATLGNGSGLNWGDTSARIRGESGASGLLRFDTNGGERARIDSSGRLLIGTTTEGQATADDLTIATSGTTGITIRSGTGNDGNIYFSDGTSGSDEFRGYVQYGHSNNSLVFGTNAGERLRIDQHGRMWINSGGLTTPTMDYKTINTVATPTFEAGITFSRSHTTMGSGSSGGQTIMLGSDASLQFNTHNVAERMRIDSSGRVVIGGTSSYIGGAALAVLGTGTTPNTYGSFAIGKVGANPTAGTTLANIRLNGGSIGTRRGAEINAIANGNWSDGSSHPTKLTFAVANENSASATQRFEINHYGHHVFTNENVFPSSGSPGTNGFKGLTQLGYQHWGWRQYYSGQQNKTQNQYFDLFSNNTAHDDIIFWLNIKGFHANRTFATAHGAIGGYGLSVSYQSASGVYGSFSAANIGSGRNALRWTSTSPYGANWWIWGWYSGTTGTGTHTGHSAAQLH